MLPILYQSPDLVIYSYPLLMGLGWGVAYQIFMAGLPVTFSRSFSQFIFWGLFISSWIGAKSLFLITDTGEEKLIDSVNFWTGGGFVFYGGLIFGGFFLGLLKFVRPSNFLIISSALLPALAVGHAIGRVGCFLAGCCFGKQTEAFWAIHLHGDYRHPTQLLEAVGLGVIAYCLFKLRAREKNLTSFYLLSYGVLRVLVELLRGDEVRGSWWGISPSLVISLFLVTLGLGLKFRENSKT